MTPAGRLASLTDQPFPVERRAGVGLVDRQMIMSDQAAVVAPFRFAQRVGSHRAIGIARGVEADARQERHQRRRQVRQGAILLRREVVLP